MTHYNIFLSGYFVIFSCNNPYLKWSLWSHGYKPFQLQTLSVARLPHVSKYKPPPPPPPRVDVSAPLGPHSYALHEIAKDTLSHHILLAVCGTDQSLHSPTKPQSITLSPQLIEHLSSPSGLLVTLRHTHALMYMIQLQNAR